MQSSIENNQDTISAQLMLLKAQTKTMGVLWEAQVLQLKFWGQIAFDAAFEIGISIEDKTVEYRLAPSKQFATKKKLPKVVAKMQEQIKWLLGNTWKLRIKENTVLVFPKQHHGKTPKRRSVKPRRKTSKR